MPNDLQCLFARDIATFMERLTAENYKPQTIKAYRVLLTRFVSLIEAAEISPQDLTAERAAELVRNDERNRRALSPILLPAARCQLRSRHRARWPVQRCASIMKSIWLGSAGSVRVRSTIPGALPTASSTIGSAATKPISRRSAQAM